MMTYDDQIYSMIISSINYLGLEVREDSVENEMLGGLWCEDTVFARF